MYAAVVGEKQDTFPKAPWPDRWVPPPRTRGIRATARPVPQDSALVWWPGTHGTQSGQNAQDGVIQKYTVSELALKMEIA